MYFFGHNYGCRWIDNTSFWPAFPDGCTRRVLREFLILSGKRRIYHSATNATITQNSRKSQRIHLRSTRSRKYLLGSGLPGAFSQQWRHSVAAAAAVTQENLKKGEGGKEVTMSLTHLDSTLGCVVSSTTLDSPARKSALPLRCPRGRPSEGGVLSRGRPGA